MKTLKFTTSKGAFALMDGKEQIDQTLKALLDEYAPVAKVSEMSEEQFSEVVDSRLVFQSQYIKDMISCYSNYSNPSEAFTSASESFSTLVQKSGWYMWENPIPPFKERKSDWQEAESKTLYSPILLKKI